MCSKIVCKSCHFISGLSFTIKRRDMRRFLYLNMVTEAVRGGMICIEVRFLHCRTGQLLLLGLHLPKKKTFFVHPGCLECLHCICFVKRNLLTPWVTQHCKLYFWHVIHSVSRNCYCYMTTLRKSKEHFSKYVTTRWQPLSIVTAGLPLHSTGNIKLNLNFSKMKSKWTWYVFFRFIRSSTEALKHFVLC